jgi:SAM-dependent methyltransferase
LENSGRQWQIIEETGKKYDDIIFEEDIIPKNVYLYQIQKRNHIIRQILAGKKYGIVLDLGCGTGFHIGVLSDYAEHLIGVDISFGALRQCRRKYPGDYVVCDIHHIPFKPNIIDFIWIAGVLHHVPRDLDHVIKNSLDRILKNNGYFLIDEPNKFNPFNHLILKISMADPTGNERPLSLSSVIKILNKNNLEIVKSIHYEFFIPFGLLLKNKRVFQLCQIGDNLFEKCFLDIFSFRWTIFGRKK